MKTDPRVDTYIAGRADFARPILEALRAAMHAACPDGEESIKWGHPHFLYRGQMLAGMAAFKAHATFGFWRGDAVLGEGQAAQGAMGQFGRIETLDDLPPRATLIDLAHKAMALTDAGAKGARSKPKAPRPTYEMPDDLAAALAAAPAAQATWDGFSPSCRREYLEWVCEAKRPETRARRLDQTLEWLAEGKKRNWKYENC